MKKILYFITCAVLCLSFASCEKEQPGMTATEPLAGQWYVQVDGINADGSVAEEDPFGAGRFLVLTYNTSANTENQIFFDDLGNFWEFKIKANADINNLTFSATGAEDLYNGITVDVSAKVVVGGATTPSGGKADYFEAIVKFSDDAYIGTYWDALRFSGWRYTGFVNDD